MRAWNLLTFSRIIIQPAIWLGYTHAKKKQRASTVFSGEQQKALFARKTTRLQRLTQWRSFFYSVLEVLIPRDLKS